MTEHEQPRENNRIGPYRIERTLGSGGMGEVVLAYDQRLDRRVAIKRIRHQHGITPQDRERFRREARAAAGLSHPAIVQIHDILADGDEDAIVMERVEGSSLAQKLKAGPLPLAETLRLGRQVAEGLAEAHRAGLIHRDLKAENVMVTPPEGSHPGRAKILDFGLAKRLAQGDPEETLTRKGAVLGTARAMSPEQARGQEVDHRTDLFSLGVLLYEMVTGESPFRGPSALTTLMRVMTVAPRPVQEMRSGVPDGLARLIERLLEKEPERRPEDAAEAARALADLAATSASAAEPLPSPASRSELDNLPTASLPPSAGTPPSPIAARPTSGESRSETITPIPPGRLRYGLAAAAVALILATISAVVLIPGTARSAEPLRIVVPRPTIETAEPSEALEQVAAGVRVATLAILADLEGVAPVDPSELAGTSGSALDVARAVAADETLVASIAERGANAWVFLRRIGAVDGEVHWASEFQIPFGLGRERLVVESLAVQLRRAYPRSVMREGVPRLEAGDADFAEFVEINRRLDSGDHPLPPELERLKTLVERSPRFLAAHLRAAKVALTLYSDTRDDQYLESAAEWIRRAQTLAPDDDVAIRLEFQLALARGETENARAVLDELERVAPNSIEVPFGHFQLARRAGDLAAAEAAIRQVIERRPSWGNFYRLADLQMRRGDVDGAREHLDEVLRRTPDNTWALGKLTQLELLYGDLERAERLAERAIAIRPHRSYFNNLGMARYFLGRYPEAKASYLQALAIDPGNLTVRLNLADAELALGQVDEARARYRRIADELLRKENLEATKSMTLAQCLARLGESQRAVAVTLETLQKHPDHAEVAYQAALVYSLVGEPASAWVNVERALARGVQPRQFEIPAFDALRSDPQFQTRIQMRTDGG